MLAAGATVKMHRRPHLLKTSFVNTRASFHNCPGRFADLEFIVRLDHVQSRRQHLEGRQQEPQDRGVSVT